MTTPATAEEYADAQAKEYGQYVAVERILIGNALAFKPGDPVPAGHVTRGVVSKDKVAKPHTKAAQAVTGQEA